MSSAALPLHRVRSRRPVAAPDPPAVPEDAGDDPAHGSDPAGTSDAERAAALALEVEQLRTAMASRAAIEQAKGILMLLTGCTDTVAFDLLAHISGHTHRKVRAVAEEITRSASGAADLPADVRTLLRDACPPGAPRP